LVLAEPDAPASMALAAIADSLASKPRGLAGMQLGISPSGRG
jgi:ATP-binding protein involved in chromosome partitioning